MINRHKPSDTKALPHFSPLRPFQHLSDRPFWELLFRSVMGLEVRRGSPWTGLFGKQGVLSLVYLPTKKAKIADFKIRPWGRLFLWVNVRFEHSAGFRYPLFVSLGSWAFCPLFQGLVHFVDFKRSSYCEIGVHPALPELRLVLIQLRSLNQLHPNRSVLCLSIAQLAS